MRYLECLSCNTPIPLGTRETMSFCTRCGTCAPSHTDMIIRRSVTTLSEEAKRILTNTALNKCANMLDFYKLDAAACIDDYIMDRKKLDDEMEELYND